MKKNSVGIFYLIAVFFVSASLSAEPSNYTYNYDYWEEQVASPDAYRVSDYILGTSLGVGNLREPQGLFIRDNRIYICDSGNNRILLLEVNEKGEHVLVNTVSSVIIDNYESMFNYPMDIYECREGFLYIADTNNRRILKLDHDWNYIFSITRPDDESIDDFVEFQPLKLIVDFANRIFVQVRNVNKGLMEFDSRGEFVGYMGANKVKFNIVDYAWKLFSTQAQRERLQLFIPTEYNNIYLDNDGFIYVTNSTGLNTTTTATGSANTQGETEPVRRLNAMGQDILIRNGYEKPIGDIAFGSAGGVSGRSRFIDVVAFDNDSFACFDRTRGRIFMYDFQGNLLYAFGGLGNREGAFLMPVAIDRMGYVIYALDSRTAALTRFELTSYGTRINNALSEYRAGRYEASAAIWEDVLKMNGNYDLAYIGIGRAALRQGDYKTAMKYYSLKHYRTGYSKAFQLYRKQWMEENIWKIVLILFALLFIPFAVRYSIKLIKEIREA